mgnify:CR=1 FL=1
MNGDGINIISNDVSNKRISFFFLMIRRQPRSTQSGWSAASDVYKRQISHGEGRFVATAEEIAQLAANGQIATQYVDFDGEPTFDIHCNPNTSGRSGRRQMD